MQKLLITGSCGFIYGNFIRQNINNPQYQLVGIDKANNGISTIIQDNNYKFYLADIVDQHVIDKIFQLEKPDIVLHTAAETHVDCSIINPNSFISSNVLGTQVIVNACVKYQVNKLIYISTDEVYGQLSNEQDQGWNEECSLNPRNPYSASKAAGELIVKAAHETFGLNYNITRASNNYGPYQTYDKLIPKVIQNIMQNKAIPIYGQGLQIRDWTHVFDNCSAVLAILDKGKPNEAYNISANQELPNIEVIKKICDVMDVGYELMTFVDERPGHDFRYSINTNKVRALGWNPEFDFEKGIVQTVKWYEERGC